VTRILTWKDIPDAWGDLVAQWKFARLVSSRLIPIFLFRKELLTYLFDCSPPYLAPPADTGQAPASIVLGKEDRLMPIAVAKEDHLKLIRSERPGVQKWFRSFRIQGLNARRLESMLAYFQVHDIATILVGVPVSRPHFECYAEIDRQFLDYMNTLVRAYGCSFVDYRNRIPDDLFRDIEHLTAEGGIEFSRVLQEEVLCEAWGKCSKELQRAGHPALHGSR